MIWTQQLGGLVAGTAELPQWGSTSPAPTLPLSLLLEPITPFSVRYMGDQLKYKTKEPLDNGLGDGKAGVSSLCC